MSFINILSLIHDLFFGPLLAYVFRQVVRCLVPPFNPIIASTLNEANTARGRKNSRMSYSIKYKVASAAIAVSLLVGGLSITGTPSAYAAEVSAVNQQAQVTWGVNMRTSSNSSSSVIRMLSKGETVTVIEIASNGWLQVQDKNGQKGYISNDSKYTETVVGSSNNSGANNGSSSTGSNSAITEKTNTYTAEITWGVNMRTSSNSSSSVIRMLSKGETVTVIGTASNGWLQVQDKNGQKGYISNDSKYTQAVGGSSNNSGSNNSGTESNTGSNSGSNTSNSSSVEKVIAAGMKYLGTPYEYGSNRNTTTTFDCSDFVRQAFIDALGIKLPADSRQQGTYVKNLGNAVTDINDLKRGDLMFFMSSKGSSKSSYAGINKSTQRITHVGIYLGDGKVLHTYSNAGGGVTTSKVTGNSWEYRFLYGGSALK